LLDFVYAGVLKSSLQVGKFILYRVGGIVQIRRPTLSILIVSTNPLFKEVIIATVAQFNIEFIECNPEESLTKVCELKPDVIIIDETVKPSSFKDLLAEARGLEKTHIIVLNPAENEIIMLDSCRATLRRADDLIEAIAGFGYEIHSESDDCKIADASEAIKTHEGKPLSE